MKLNQSHSVGRKGSSEVTNPRPCSKQVQLEKVIRSVFNAALSISNNNDSTASQGT